MAVYECLGTIAVKGVLLMNKAQQRIYYPIVHMPLIHIQMISENFDFSFVTFR